MRIAAINRLSALKDNADVQRSVTRQFQHFLGDVADMCTQALDEIVRHWETPVRFRADIEEKGGDFEISISVDTPIFIYVDEGTPPHIIEPVHARALRFVAAGEVVFTKRVHHPGNAPQHLTRQALEIVERDVPDFIRTLEISLAEDLGGSP